MQSAETPSSPRHFLGVRLTAEEIDRLDRFQKAQESPTRSDAVRALVRAADRLSQVPLELPAAVDAQLDELVDDGWAENRDGALTLVLTLGLSELARIHADGLPKLHRRAKDLDERRENRRRADREGRGRLER